MQNEEKPYKRSGIIFISSVLSIAMVLTLLGIIGLLYIQSGKLKMLVKEKVQMTVYLNEQANSVSIDSLLILAKKNPIVKSCRFITAEVAAATLSRDLGQDFVHFLGFNPLKANIEINLNGDYANSSQMAELKSQLIHIPIVQEVSYPENMLDDIDSNLQFISSLLAAIAFLFLIVSVFLMNHSVHLQLYARRFTIKSMQLVGATDAFILKPFLWKAFWQGLSGAILAAIFCFILLYLAPLLVPGLENLYDFPLFAALFGLLLALGILLNFLSTWIITAHYLKTESSKLH